MITTGQYIGYYVGMFSGTFMMIGLIYFGLSTIKNIWNKKLNKHIEDLLTWNKQSIFFVFGFLGKYFIKFLSLFIPIKWAMTILSAIYLGVSLIFLFFGTVGLYMLVTEFYFFPTERIQEILTEFY
ncbi:MAG: hypothetical protein K0S34_475 [Bacillales bacterium]|nr:hypothetical protein [Bacillales bacterium]